MKKLLSILPVLMLTGCAGLRPYGTDAGVSIPLNGEGASITVTFDRLPKGLLVTYDVADGELVAKPDEKIWMSDSVELYMDLRPYRERAMFNSYGRGVFQIIAVPPVDGHSVRSEFLSYGFPIPEGFSAKGVLTEAGYRLQIFLPEESMLEIHGPLRETIYLDVALKNVSSDGGEESVFWNGNNDNWQYPNNFAPLTLP